MIEAKLIAKKGLNVIQEDGVQKSKSRRGES